jgi:hypothetical protein
MNSSILPKNSSKQAVSEDDTEASSKIVVVDSTFDEPIYGSNMQSNSSTSEDSVVTELEVEIAAEESIVEEEQPLKKAKTSASEKVEVSDLVQAPLISSSEANNVFKSMFDGSRKLVEKYNLLVKDSRKRIPSRGSSEFSECYGRSSRRLCKKVGVKASIFESIQTFRESSRRDRKVVNVDKLKQLSRRSPMVQGVRAGCMYLDRNLRRSISVRSSHPRASCTSTTNPISAYMSSLVFDRDLLPVQSSSSSTSGVGMKRGRGRPAHQPKPSSSSSSSSLAHKFGSFF